MGKNRNEGKNGGKRSDEAKLPWDEGVAYKKWWSITGANR